MKKSVIIVIILCICISLTEAQMIPLDTLIVTKKEEVDAKLIKLTRELDLTENQQAEISKLLYQRLKHQIETATHEDIDLIGLLNFQQRETFMRLKEIDEKCNSNVKSLNIHRSTQSIAQHSLTINTASKLKDVRLLINNHPDGSHSANTNYSTFNRVTMQAWTYSGQTMFRRTAMKFILDDIPNGSDIISYTESYQFGRCFWKYYPPNIRQRSGNIE